MLVSTASTIISTWLDDPNNGYFTTATIITWLNLAQRHVQNELLQAGNNWYLKPVETTLIPGQSDYLFPLDFLQEHRLEVVLSDYGTPNENCQAITPITLNQQDMVSRRLGNPTNYYFKKDRLVVSPTPQFSNILRLHYSPRTIDVTVSTDSLDVPEQFAEYACLTAAFDGFIKDDRAPDNLVLKKNRYEEMIKKMAVDRINDIPRQVVNVMDFDNYNFY
jgi:hypothetical protein